jgi:hypothetical protein
MPWVLSQAVDILRFGAAVKPVTVHGVAFGFNLPVRSRLWSMERKTQGTWAAAFTVRDSSRLVGDFSARNFGKFVMTHQHDTKPDGAGKSGC